MVQCRHGFFSFLFFSLNWPRRGSVNGKFLPHITQKWGWKGRCEKSSMTKLCFQLSTFKRLVQIQSTKVIKHFIVTDQTGIVNCAMQATIMSENYQVSIKKAQTTFYCRSVLSCCGKPQQSSVRVLGGDASRSWAPELSLTCGSPPPSAIPSQH